MNARDSERRSHLRHALLPIGRPATMMYGTPLVSYSSAAIFHHNPIRSGGPY